MQRSIMMAQQECQLYGLESMSEGRIPVKPESVVDRLRLIFLRHVPFRTTQAIKRTVDHLVSRFQAESQDGKAPSAEAGAVSVTKHLKAGDLVRVRPVEEIQATLSYRGELRGCVFMREMHPYCETTQRVLKPIERFLDERDYQLKKCKGMVLLEGIMCQGTELFGSCDRSCYFFWREEWLERVD
jgi:hypothetical protein